MTDYLDTSFLYRVFFPGEKDAESARAEMDIRQRSGGFVSITPFGRFEFVYSLRWQMWLHRNNAKAGIPPSIAEPMLALFMASLGTDIREAQSPDMVSIMAAAELLSRDTPVRGWRAMDLIHVATASRLGSQRFYTFDKPLGEAARSLGMKTPLRALEG